MSKKLSLKQFLMKSGKFSKVYDCIKAITNGKVTVNKNIITNPNFFFNPKQSLIRLNDERIKKAPKLYFLMNKPSGYLTQKSPGEKSIYDLLKSLKLPEDHIKSLFAVGRLDKDTEGLIVLTNDGKLADSIAQPDNRIIKKYYCVLEKYADINKIRLLEKGVVIIIDGKKYRTKPCKIEIIGKKEIYISLTEGKKRQLRKMLESIANNIVYLKRVSIGSLQLGDIKTGDVREITVEEINKKLIQ